MKPMVGRAGDLRPRLTGRYLVDFRLDLTGTVTEGCTFDGCIVELNDTLVTDPRTFLNRCLFIDCRLIGKGWSRSELHRLNSINQPWEPRKPA